MFFFCDIHTLAHASTHTTHPHTESDTHRLAGYSKILTSESKRGETVDSRQGERQTGEGEGGGGGREREREIQRA